MEEKFNVVKKGYDMSEVNTYIETLEKVVASYKDKDNAIKNALINAQITAENIVKNAELEADKIVSKAVKLLETINGSIASQRSYLQSYQDEYNAIVGKYLQKFNDEDITKLHEKVNELENYISSIKDSAPPAQTQEASADSTDAGQSEV